MYIETFISIKDKSCCVSYPHSDYFSTFSTNVYELKHLDSKFKNPLVKSLSNFFFSLLQMTVFANSYDHLTIDRITYIESCNIGTILQAQQSIRDFDLIFTPQDVVKVSYYINSNVTDEQKFEVTFASNKNATYVIMSRCTLGPENIHAIGYFKNCSFAITCKNYVETKFLEHNKCGKRVTREC